MLVISGRIFIDVKIDGHSLDNAPNVFATLSMSESVAGLFPAALLVLNDYSGQLTNQLALTEGNAVVVTVGYSPNDANTITRQFRLFGLKQHISSYGPQMHLRCIYDAPKYISEAAVEHYNCNSSSALQAIADLCKLYYCGPESSSGRTMNDSQNWWNVNRSRASFVQHNIARHGYQDDASAMCSVLTSMGEIRYRNLMDVIAKPLGQIKYLFAHSSPASDEDRARQVYLVDQVQAHSDAGLMNSWQNYGSTRVVHSNSGVTQTESSVNVKTSGKYLAINDQVSQTVGRARYDHSLLDCGNVNEKYERALYQNVKQLGLFSERVSILVSEPTAVQLLDPVLYRENYVDPKEISNQSDVYIVIGKTIYVKGGQYYAERLELVRMTLTAKGDSSLKCAPTPESSASTAVPISNINPTAFSQPGSPGTVARQLGVANELQQGAALMDRANASTVASALAVSKAATNVGPAALAAAGIVQSGQAGIVANPAKTLSTLQGVSTSLNAYNTTTGNFANSFLASGVKTLEYAKSVINNPALTQAVRISTLLKPGGLVASQAAIMGAISLNKQTSDVFRSTLALCNTSQSFATLTGHPGGSQTLQNFTNQVNALSSNTTLVNTGLVSSWNGALSIATGKPVPDKINGMDPNATPATSTGALNWNTIPSSSSTLYSTVASSLAPPVGYQASVKSPTDVQSDYTKNLLKTNSDGSLPWSSLSGYTSYSDPIPLVRAQAAMTPTSSGLNWNSIGAPGSSNVNGMNWNSIAKPQVTVPLNGMDWGSLSKPITPLEVLDSSQTLASDSALYQSQQAQSYV